MPRFPYTDSSVNYDLDANVSSLATAVSQTYLRHAQLEIQLYVLATKYL